MTAEAVLEIRVELIDSEPVIWRRLDIRGAMALNQMHQVLQVAFGWEDIHLHRFTALEPFVRLRPVNGVYPDDLQWLPRQECFDPDDRPEEDLSLEQCSFWVAAKRSTSTTSATAGCTVSSCYHNALRTKVPRLHG
ncbi:plasmid pRiA4b ORF-3 family protein [Paenarthrobacter sp. PAE-2]|uniref:plasmid pRiA4b ORF-3 family protein n=1 Tax=Paenarthrobacter sp. PAE-2 TaxID=2982532 RepID=UPI00222F03FC|nr:plasmid pRiA4b ORF-3 family protein [Paenarthrobacter sp. PAE-2]MCW3768895.1 plasmid pRiA4b ORF-3 family protein [Paenarthrobacter sp. PAE-2]